MDFGEERIAWFCDKCCIILSYVNVGCRERTKIVDLKLKCIHEYEGRGEIERKYVNAKE